MSNVQSFSLKAETHSFKQTTARMMSPFVNVPPLVVCSQLSLATESLRHLRRF